MQTLLLVDGSSYLYRAFHAMPDLRNPTGEPTGAIYGMVAMLKRLRQDYPTQYIACVFDAKGKTFRDDWYPEYKATRKAMPDDLVLQIEPINEVVAALGWPILCISGVEADDVIATLATRASAAGMKTIISTGDKDLAQLVNDSVTLVNTMSNETLDHQGVVEKFGVPPERIVDYLSLVGDTVDNVPGVEKVGPKTALKWLAQYESLDGVVAHAAEIGGVVGENLRRAVDWLPMARKLVTVKSDCDLGELGDSIEAQLAAREPDRTRLHEQFKRLGFRTWLRELEGGAVPTGSGAGAAPEIVASAPALPVAAPDQLAGNYETIKTEQQLLQWLARLETAPLTAFDTETTSLDVRAARLVGMSFCVNSGHAAYLPLRHRSLEAGQAQLDFDATLARLKHWLEGAQYPKVGQNLKYDTHVLANHGIRLGGIAHDTLLESYVLEAHRDHGLDDLARRHLQRSVLSYEEVCGKGANQIGFDEVGIERATQYAAEDADLTLRVHEVLYPRILADAGLRYVYESIELPTSIVLTKIEDTGVLIDAAVLTRQSAELGNRLLDLEAKAIELAGQPFNLNSPKQIGEIFFDKLKLPVVKKTASGAPSTDEEVLQKLAEDYPLPKVLLDYRALAKLKSTYTDKLPRMIDGATGRVHTTYAQAVAVTGRLASNDPNLQNIPIRTPEGRRVREAFIASPGARIVSADYSQIELRIMAHISGDPGLCAAFEQGEDVHRATAAEIFSVAAASVSSEQRRYAKVINFGLIYGMSPFGLAAALSIERDAAKLYIDRYFARYPGVAQYMQQTRLSAKEKGYVETAFGRRLWLPEINSPNGPRRQGAERAAINAPMQGTAADLIKLSMLAVDAWLVSEKLRSRLIMQVHDELVLEVPESELDLIETRVRELMTGVAKLRVPLEVEVGVGNNWDEAH